jgi:hypothetical protein
LQSPLNPIIDFNENRRWDDERLTSLLDEPPGCPVIGVVSIERGVEWTGVED